MEWRSWLLPVTRWVAEPESEIMAIDGQSPADVLPAWPSLILFPPLSACPNLPTHGSFLNKCNICPSRIKGAHPNLSYADVLMTQMRQSLFLSYVKSFYKPKRKWPATQIGKWPSVWTDNSTENTNNSESIKTCPASFTVGICLHTHITEPFKNSKTFLKSPKLLIKMDTPRMFHACLVVNLFMEDHRCTLVCTFSNCPSMAIGNIVSHWSGSRRKYKCKKCHWFFF